MEIAQIADRSLRSPQLIRIVSDDQRAIFRALVESLHDEGDRVLVQVFHPDREGSRLPEDPFAVARSPCEVPAGTFHVVSRPMSAANIAPLSSSSGAPRFA
tara:strand:+ start:256 stop:558 length:303 start_codon:yes stop_codon:yes gene_type:complete